MSGLELVAFLIFLLAATALAAFGWAFRDTAATEAALRRVQRRQRAFRWGFIPLLLGIAVTSEAQAVLWRSGAARDAPEFMVPQAVGLALIMVGLTVLDLAVWWPEAEGGAAGRQ